MECKAPYWEYFSLKIKDWNISRMECKDGNKIAGGISAITNWNISRMECKVICDIISYICTQLEYIQNGM